MKWNYFLTAIATAVVLGFVVFGFVHRSELVVLTPQGFIGMEEREIMGITTLLSAVAVIPVFVLLSIFLWKYRSNNPHAVRKHKPNWDHDNWIMELLWWLIPALIILILSLVIWQSSHELDPYKPIEGNGEALTVEVVALTWKWLFIYPEQGIATVNELEIPVGRPVHFIITADAPMNSFWIPSLGGQIMAMPGMKTELNLLAHTIGIYEGASANISGTGFSGMKFPTKVVSQTEFEEWVAQVKGEAAHLTQNEYDTLSAPSENVPARYYAQITNDLFDTIVMRSMMGGEDASVSSHPMPTMDGVHNMEDMRAMDMHGSQMAPAIPATSTTSSTSPSHPTHVNVHPI